MLAHVSDLGQDVVAEWSRDDPPRAEVRAAPRRSPDGIARRPARPGTRIGHLVASRFRQVVVRRRRRASGRQSDPAWSRIGSNPRSPKVELALPAGPPSVRGASRAHGRRLIRVATRGPFVRDRVRSPFVRDSFPREVRPSVGPPVPDRLPTPIVRPGCRLRSGRPSARERRRTGADRRRGSASSRAVP